ncbi:MULTISPECIES: hypothetical protein [Agrobacterium]|uniref:Uncharacterized protein n=1 Tax=Agrobacterium tumefaciens TaxID=358 RepID=A0AAF0KAT8_AGRTU|nr:MULTISPECIES: hypothetical protein [Agrobacterium]TZG34927.1 hypothetical protein AGR1_19940 [Agrobacterium sp. B1(2019)]WGM61404.1 hypothetical protein CFBP5506_17340 [Agrobacterium tumefaciens]CVI63577.1 conserved hypothetical protein [Agrobacterium salinitolerans str. Hayward 0363]
MALQKFDDRWWSDIVRTEIRLSLKEPRSLCILPPPRTRTKSPRAGLFKRTTTGLVSKARALLGRQPGVVSTDSCTDQADAYLHACLAAPFFCYVSPAICGLPNSITCDEQGAEQNISRPGDDI